MVRPNQNNKHHNNPKKSLADVRQYNNLSSQISLEEACKIIGGYTKASPSMFKVALEMVEQKDKEFAKVLLSLNKNSLNEHTSSSNISAEDLYNNVTFIKEAYETDTKLKNDVLNDQELSSAFNHTQVFGNENKELSSSEKNDVFYANAQNEAFVQLAIDNNFAQKDDNAKRNELIAKLKSSILSGIKESRLNSALETSNSEKSNDKEDSSFFSKKISRLKKALDLKNPFKVTQKALRNVLTKTKNKFSSLSHKVMLLAKNAQDGSKIIYSKVAKNIHKIALCILVAAPAYTACTQFNANKEQKNDKNNVEFKTNLDSTKTVQKLNTVQDLSIKGAKADTVKVDTVKNVSDSLTSSIQSQKNDSINLQQHNDSTITKPVIAPQKVAEVKNHQNTEVKDSTDSVQVSSATVLNADSVQKITENDSIDNVVLDSEDIKVGTLAADNVESRGGYLNTGITEKQYHRMEKFFKNKYGEDAFESFQERITDDMRAKGGVFAGLSKAQSLFCVQQMIAWSNDKTGKFAPQINAVIDYLKGCDEEISLSQVDNVKAIIDAVNVNGSIDGITGKNNVMVKYYQSNDCGEKGEYALKEVEGNETISNPVHEKFLRLFKLEKEQPQRDTVVVDLPDKIILEYEEEKPSYGDIYKGEIPEAYVDSVSSKVISDNVDLNRYNPEFYVPTQATDTVSVEQSENGKIFKGDIKDPVVDNVPAQEIVDGVQNSKESNGDVEFYTQKSSSENEAVTSSKSEPTKELSRREIRRQKRAEQKAQIERISKMVKDKLKSDSINAKKAAYLKHCQENNKSVNLEIMKYLQGGR